jgi:hypothetical protein
MNCSDRPKNAILYPSPKFTLKWKLWLLQKRVSLASSWSNHFLTTEFWNTFSIFFAHFWQNISKILYYIKRTALMTLFYLRWYSGTPALHWYQL